MKSSLLARFAALACSFLAVCTGLTACNAKIAVLEETKEDSGKSETDDAGCTRALCSTASLECGVAPDGCGGMLDCGECSTGAVCQDNQCSASADACAPSTCLELDVECGVIANRCGQMLDCGDCASGTACAAGRCLEIP